MNENAFFPNSAEERSENYVVPEGVKRIDDRAFAACLQLKSVTIPEGVEELGLGAVDFCSSLRLVVLPKSVVVIPEDFFRLTSNLKVRAPKGSCAEEFVEEYNEEVSEKYDFDEKIVKNGRIAFETIE